MDLEFFKDIKSNLDTNQIDQYEKFYKLINEHNKVMNLTAIDQYEAVYLKHFYDSLTVIDLIKEINPKTIADLGSGVGVPGIVLAIYFKNIQFTLIEPLTKRCNFLELVIKELKLSNVTILNQRAELINTKYGLVIARAVKRLNILLELSIPLLNVNGSLIALKGPKAKEELEEAQNALNILSSTVLKIDKVILPIENSTRYNLVIKKLKETNKKYPRNYSQISKKPL
ncbi:MAG: 16S rRNA (guanine(527)-N(7))-methyltransferase RsmG [Mycoplasmatales bacterium]